MNVRAMNVRLSDRAALVGSVLLTLLACAPSLSFDFVEWDDPVHVTRNPLVVDPGSMPLREHFLTPGLGYPIPLTILSYRVEHALFGLAPWIFHATNILLHTTVTVLAFVLARRLGLSALGGATAALFFALHPANAETMSWISGRKDLLAAGLGLAALLMSLGTLRVRVLSVLLYACALLSKPAAAPFAALAALLPYVIDDDAPEHDANEHATPLRFVERVKQIARRFAPYLVVLVPITYLGILGQAAVGATSDEKLATIPRWHSVLYAAGHHASLILGWTEPTVKYFPSEWPPLHFGKTDAALAVLLAALGLCIFVCRGRLRRIALFGVAFAALGYLPSSSLVFRLTRYLADAYVYLPVMGVGLVLGAVLDRCVEVAPRLSRALRIVPFALALALMPLFVISSSRFTDELVLWSHARARFPGQNRVCRQWANAVVMLRGPEPGLEAIDTCIERFGDTLFVKNRGVVLSQLGRNAEARTWLERARKSAPKDQTVEDLLRTLGGGSTP